MKLRKIAIALVSLTLLVTGCSNTQNSESSENSDISYHVCVEYPTYKTIDELGDKADIIIKGYMTKSKVIDLNSASTSEGHFSIYTYYTIKITQAIKGKYQINDTVEMRQLGGEVNGEKLTSEGSIDFKMSPQNEYVFFLREYPCEMLNPYQGCYEYNSESSEFTSLVAQNPIIPTVSELIRLKEKYKK